MNNQPKMNIKDTIKQLIKDALADCAQSGLLSQCENCENLYFSPVIRLKRISPLMSPTGKEAIYPVQVMSCTKCNEIFNDLKE